MSDIIDISSSSSRSPTPDPNELVHLSQKRARPSEDAEPVNPPAKSRKVSSATSSAKPATKAKEQAKPSPEPKASKKKEPEPSRWPYIDSCRPEMRFKGTKIWASNCGGDFFSATGKTMAMRLDKLEKFLEECDGDENSHPTYGGY